MFNEALQATTVTRIPINDALTQLSELMELIPVRPVINKSRLRRFNYALHKPNVLYDDGNRQN